MAAVINCRWTNWNGGPGVTKFYTEIAPTDAELGSIRDFFSDIATTLPSGLNVLVENQGDLFDPATGDLTGRWSGLAVAEVIGTASGAYASNAGMVVNWRTNTIRRGRFVRGRTFLVPMSAVYQTDGTISLTPLAQVRSAATELITELAGNLKVWARPDELGAGLLATVTSADVPDMAATLRSRRGRG